jgi:hypothetical protein
MLAGCGNANRGKIVGTWEIDRADSVLSRIDRSSVDAGENDSAQDSHDGAAPKMVLTFSRSGKLATATNMGAVVQEKQGTWKMTSFDEQSSLMQVDCVLQGQNSTHEIEFLDQETIKLIPPNMAGTKLKLKFKRQK